MAVDLGHGTTQMWAGGPEPVSCSVWVLEDGTRVYIPVRRLQALALSLQHGNREAGFRMGVAETTVKAMLSKLNRQLGTFNKWEAACALGWVACPSALLDASPEVVVADGGRSVAGPGEGRSAVVPPRNSGVAA